jgi:hypothetical protein
MTKKQMIVNLTRSLDRMYRERDMAVNLLREVCNTPRENIDHDELTAALKRLEEIK